MNIGQYIYLLKEKKCYEITTITDKISVRFEDESNWSDYEESEERIICFPDADLVSDANGILPGRIKRARGPITDDSEPSEASDTSPEEWI